jgi:hypothetical protein
MIRKDRSSESASGFLTTSEKDVSSPIQTFQSSFIVAANQILLNDPRFLEPNSFFTAIFNHFHSFPQGSPGSELRFDFLAPASESDRRKVNLILQKSKFIHNFKGYTNYPDVQKHF